MIEQTDFPFGDIEPESGSNNTLLILFIILILIIGVYVVKELLPTTYILKEKNNKHLN